MRAQNTPKNKKKEATAEIFASSHSHCIRREIEHEKQMRERSKESR
jgi:hypothetical protein